MAFQTQRRVEFRDTDAAGIVHFSAFFPWMESAEHEMLRAAGVKILPDGHEDQETVTWPRVSASCDYRNAARFEDELSVHVSVSRIGTSSIQHSIRFARPERDGTLTPIAEGKFVVVCCRLRPGGGLEKTAIPDEIRQRLMKYVD